MIPDDWQQISGQIAVLASQATAAYPFGPWLKAQLSAHGAAVSLKNLLTGLPENHEVTEPILEQLLVAARQTQRALGEITAAATEVQDKKLPNTDLHILEYDIAPMVKSFLEMDELSQPVFAAAGKKNAIMDELLRNFRDVTQQAHLPESSWKLSLSSTSTKDEVLSAVSETFTKLSASVCEEALKKWEEARFFGLMSSQECAAREGVSHVCCIV